MRAHSYSIDLLRGVAAFFIVSCHLDLLPMTRAAWNLRWFSDMFVGLFAALSGYLMVSAVSSNDGGVAKCWWQYANKRARRILPAYLFWTIAYVALSLAVDSFVRGGLNPKWYEASHVFKVIFEGYGAIHLWFLISLLYGQLIIGFVAIAFPRMGGFSWCVIGLLLLGVSIGLGEGWLGYYFLRVVAFLAAGISVRKLEDALSKINVGFWWAAFVVGAVVHFFLRSSVPSFARDWIMAVPLLVIAARTSIPPKCESAARLLGSTSMGVFLVHPLFAALMALALRRVLSFPCGVLPFAMDWLIVWLLSLGATLILFRVPYIVKVMR